MTVQETLGEAFEKVANIQNTIDDIKDVIGKIEKNNPMIGDLEESVGSIAKIIESAQEKNISGVIENGVELARELSKLPGDTKDFIDTKGTSLLNDASDIKDEVVNLVKQIGSQFNEIIGDLKEGGLQGFLKAFNDLTSAITEDIQAGKGITDKVEHMVDTLEVKGDIVKASEGLKGVGDVKDAGGKDGQQAPTTPGQDVGGQGQGMAM
jgi:hypothetical protein